MARFKFYISYQGHAHVVIDADSLEEAKENLQGEIEMNILGTLDNYSVDGIQEPPPES